MKIKPRRLWAYLIGVLTGVILTLGATAPTHASWYLTNQNFDTACALANGDQYKAIIVAENTLGWRCYDTSTGTQKSVDVQHYCDVAHPGSLALWNIYRDTHGWRCEKA